MKSMVYAIVLATFVLTTVFVISGCNTVRGMGQDIQALGHGVEHVFDKK